RHGRWQESSRAWRGSLALAHARRAVRPALGHLDADRRRFAAHATWRDVRAGAAADAQRVVHPVTAVLALDRPRRADRSGLREAWVRLVHHAVDGEAAAAQRLAGAVVDVRLVLVLEEAQRVAHDRGAGLAVHAVRVEQR